MLKTNRFAVVAAAILLAAPVMAAFQDADARVRSARGGAATQRGAAHGQRTPREHGSRTRNTTITGPNGGQRTTQNQRTWDRSDGVYTHNRTTTFNDGPQRTVETDVLRTGPGTFSASREVTGRNGETRVQTGEFTRTRTEDGRTLTGDINTPHHGQIDYTRSVTHENGGRSVNSSAVFEDGSAITRSSSASCAEGVCTSSGVVTDRQGRQTSWDQTRTRTEDGATLERDVTFADGTTRSVDAERTGNGDGTGTFSRTVTGRDGQTRTQTGEYGIDRTP